MGHSTTIHSPEPTADLIDLIGLWITFSHLHLLKRDSKIFGWGEREGKERRKENQWGRMGRTLNPLHEIVKEK
jgi:hypothetical protein